MLSGERPESTKAQRSEILICCDRRALFPCRPLNGKGKAVSPRPLRLCGESLVWKTMLECAIHGKADLLVTGDKEILRLKEYEGVKIISLKEYLQR